MENKLTISNHFQKVEPTLEQTIGLSPLPKTNPSLEILMEVLKIKSLNENESTNANEKYSGGYTVIHLDRLLDI